MILETGIMRLTGELSQSFLTPQAQELSINTHLLTCYCYSNYNTITESKNITPNSLIFMKIWNEAYFTLNFRSDMCSSCAFCILGVKPTPLAKHFKKFKLEHSISGNLI